MWNFPFNVKAVYRNLFICKVETWRSFIYHDHTTAGTLIMSAAILLLHGWTGLWRAVEWWSFPVMHYSKCVTHHKEMIFCTADTAYGLVLHTYTKMCMIYLHTHINTHSHITKTNESITALNYLTVFLFCAMLSVPTSFMSKINFKKKKSCVHPSIYYLNLLSS